MSIFSERNSNLTPVAIVIETGEYGVIDLTHSYKSGHVVNIAYDAINVTTSTAGWFEVGKLVTDIKPPIDVSGFCFDIATAELHPINIEGWSGRIMLFVSQPASNKRVRINLSYTR